MRDESNLFEPLLTDGDHNKLIPVQTASYWEKLWGILPRSSITSWLDFEKNTEHGVCGSSHKSTMTEIIGPPFQRRTLILILVLLTPLALLIFMVVPLCFFYNAPLWRQQSPVEVGRIRGGENVKTAILVAPKNLTIATLMEAMMQEPRWGAMKNCLDEAIREFSLEPDMVKKNARMILQCNGTKQEFLSGKGENHINVFWIDGKAHYMFDESILGVHNARLGRHTLPLNLTSISVVLQDLAAHNGSKDLLGCLAWALHEFPMEPMKVQDNAKLVVSCGGQNLSFISGEGQNKISVYRECTDVYRECADGEIQFKVKATGLAWWDRLFKRQRIS